MRVIVGARYAGVLAWYIQVYSIDITYSSWTAHGPSNAMIGHGQARGQPYVSPWKGGRGCIMASVVDPSMGHAIVGHGYGRWRPCGTIRVRVRVSESPSQAAWLTLLMNHDMNYGTTIEYL